MAPRIIVVGGGCELNVFPIPRLLGTDLLTVSGLSAAHTVYLAGGNVLLLDKNSTLEWSIFIKIADLIDQTSSEETPQKPLQGSTLLLQGHKSTRRLATALNNSTTTLSNQHETRLGQI